MKLVVDAGDDGLFPGSERMVVVWMSFQES